MKNNTRYLEIDILRGLAIVAMILIHTCYYFLSDKIALFIWNWSQFAVPIFIFCSAYLFFKNPKELSFLYFKKRFTRLIYPYYIFLLFFIPLFLFLNPQIPPIKYLIQSLTLTGGVDINWLVLLFVYMTIIFPLIATCFKKYKFLFVAFSTLSALSSVLFVFIKIPFSYKFILWLPWSLIPIFTQYFVLYEHKKNFRKYITIIFSFLFAASYFLEKVINRNLGMYENKYPPTIYFLSYGIFITMFIYIISKLTIRNKIITRFISFLSFFSYSIYFIHYTVLIALAAYLKYLNLNWFTFFLIVLATTIVIQIGINKLRKINSNKYLV